MITRATLSTIEQGLPKYRSMLAGNTAYVPNSFESIATITSTAGATSITFSSIPATYAHLQLRYEAQRNSTSSQLLPVLRFNSDTGSNYVWHGIVATQASSSGGGTGFTSSTYMAAMTMPTNATTNKGYCIVDINDYAKTTKTKTIHQIGGYSSSSVADISYASGMWNNTAAIDTLTVFFQGDAIVAGCSFALYGLKE